MSILQRNKHTKLLLSLLLGASTLADQPQLQAAALTRLITVSFTAWWLQALDREYFKVKYGDLNSVKRSERNLVLKSYARQLRQDTPLLWQANVQVAEQAYERLERLLSD